MKTPSLVELRSVQRKRRIFVVAGMFLILIIGVGIGTYLLLPPQEPLESSFIDVRDHGSSKAAVVQLRNISERRVSFRASRLYYRFGGEAWDINPPSIMPAGLNYPSYANPGTSVDFPIPLRTQAGRPITGALKVGILYSTTKKTWVGSLPAGIRNSIGTAVGITEGKSVKAIHWIELMVP